MNAAEPLRANLLAVADAYMKATREKQRTVSRRFYGHPDFLARFRAGKSSITLDKYDELMKAFYDAWPEGTARPYLRPIRLAFAA
jgi:hypothetical protein